jgi:hypothetical protein
MKTYVRFIVAGDINLPQSIVVQQSVYVVDSDLYFNNTHRTLCCVSTATLVKRTRPIVTLYNHCCLASYKPILLQASNVV